MEIGSDNDFGPYKPLDFLAASGRAGFEAIANWKKAGSDEAKEQVVNLLETTLARFSFAEGPLDETGWLELLGHSSEEDSAVLYVPDLQVDLPLVDWHGSAEEKLSQFDLIPVQLTGLKSPARKLGATVVGGRCMPVREKGGWRVVADIADETILIHNEDHRDEEDSYVLEEDGRWQVRLERRSYWSEDGDREPDERVEIDTSFCDWRNVKVKE